MACPQPPVAHSAFRRAAARLCALSPQLLCALPPKWVIALAVLVSGCGESVAPVTPVVAEPPTVAAAINVAPTAVFAVSPRWPQPGDTVTFDARYSVDSDGLVVEHEWNFGNGITQVTGAQAKTVFRTAGTYTVTLTARDDSNATASASLGLVVSAAGAPAGSVNASQSTLSLSAASVNAGATAITATVTARNASGTAVSGVPVRIGSEGRALAMVQPTGVTPGSGVLTGTIASRVAQTTTLRAIADYVLLDAAPALTVIPAIVSASASTVRRTDSLVTKFGDSTLVEITARDADGNAVAGANVSVSLTGGTATVTNEGVTDAAVPDQLRGHCAGRSGDGRRGHADAATDREGHVGRDLWRVWCDDVVRRR
jgi:PKD repeat protein